MNINAVKLSKIIGLCLANKQILLKYQSSSHKLEKVSGKLFNTNDDEISAAHITETVEQAENKDEKK